MKQYGHDAEEHSSSETGGGIVPLRDQLSIDNGTWLEMEHTTGNQIIPLETTKRSLVSLNVTLDDFEHGCGPLPVLQKSSRLLPGTSGPEERTGIMFPADKFRRKFR